MSGDGYIYKLTWVNIEIDGDFVTMVSSEKMEMYDTDEDSARRYAAKVAARDGVQDVILRRRPEPKEWEDVPIDPALRCQGRRGD